MELPKASPVAQQGIRKQQLLRSQHPPLPSPLQSPSSLEASIDGSAGTLIQITSLAK